MVGAQKLRYKEASDRQAASGNGSSSGETSSSGNATRSARTDASQPHRSTTSGNNRGFDGNVDPSDQPTERNPNASRIIVDPKRSNFDLGMGGWAVARGNNDVSTTLPARPPPSKLGVAIKVGLNTFHVESFPNCTVYQYEVSIGDGAEKRGVINKVWNSQAVQQAVGKHCLFDGVRLAWSGQHIDREIKLSVDLDLEQGRKAKPGKKPDVHRIVIRETNKVGFESLMAYLKGKASFDNTCLEAINFADHLLRQTPSTRYTQIKRNFFETGTAGKRFELGSGVEAFKGVYQSLRMVHPGRLSVNLDVANGTFWVAQTVDKAAAQVCGARDVSDLSNQLRGGSHGRAGKELNKLRKVHVVASHRGGNKDEYCIEKFIFQSAKAYKVQVVDPQGKEVEMSLSDFFNKKYNIRLSYPDLPLCKMTRGKNTVLPMEVLAIKQNQRYAYKMDERQTSNMIKFAVTAPPERYTAIEHGLKMLAWEDDPLLKQYGVRINKTKTIADARLLTAPTVKFGTGDAKPGTSGRWDLKGKKFLECNKTPLKSWAVCVVSGRRGGKPDRATIERFVSEFCKGYKGLGGRVENQQPAMSLAQGDDVGKWVTEAWNAAGNQSQMRPQMLMFILPDKDSNTYGRIKRSCECRYGVVSQCVQYSHAQKCQAQYIANVCMKFNAKLGGVTCKAVGQKTTNGHFTVPTMVIGADVSHGAPGTVTPSMAAMTVSIDKLATRYAALCQSNGYRVEMISTDTINNDLKPMIQHWMQNVGQGKVPQVIIYLRDGVSEGQFQHVLQQEVADMKAMLRGADPSGSTKWIVAIAGKRHHIRNFPEKGDKAGNAHPGTLVETGVTHPFENDFYLQSHAAIKGTARPTHYSVLLNEPNMSNDQLITMLYEHAYQYQRASTPISSHPAVYYAHLASNRAVPHDPKWSGSSDATPTGSTAQRSGSQSGSQGQSAGRSGSSSGAPAEFEKLMPMPNQGGINTSMWYI